jgi:hypothetical protein
MSVAQWLHFGWCALLALGGFIGIMAVMLGFVMLLAWVCDLVRDSEWADNLSDSVSAFIDRVCTLFLVSLFVGLFEYVILLVAVDICAT